MEATKKRGLWYPLERGGSCVGSSHLLPSVILSNHVQKMVSLDLLAYP
jgi:hypothetical protein